MRLWLCVYCYQAHWNARLARVVVARALFCTGLCFRSTMSGTNTTGRAATRRRISYRGLHQSAMCLRQSAIRLSQDSYTRLRIFIRVRMLTSVRCACACLSMQSGPGIR
eukprot:3406666-Rhodomonas_salina.2